MPRLAIIQAATGESMPPEISTAALPPVGMGIPPARHLAATDVSAKIPNFYHNGQIGVMHIDRQMGKALEQIAAHFSA